MSSLSEVKMADDVRAVRETIRRLKRRGEYDELASVEVAKDAEALGFRLLVNVELTDEDVSDLIDSIQPVPHQNRDDAEREVERVLRRSEVSNPDAE